MTDNNTTVLALLRSVRALCVALLVMLVAVGVIGIVLLRMIQSSDVAGDERRMFQRQVFCDVYDVFNEAGIDKKPPAVLKCEEL